MLAYRNVKASRSISRVLQALRTSCLPWRQSSQPHRVVMRPWSSTTSYHAKRVIKKSIKLTQGSIDGPSLPPADKTDRQETLMQLVRRIITQYPECVVLTRVGKFYELYFEHAEEYGPKLDLRVVRKNKDEIPTAGFPYMSLERYLRILVQDLDVHVVLCDEYHQRDANGNMVIPVERKVSRVVTAATLIDENFLDKDKNNYLLSICSASQEHDTEQVTFGLAWMDVSTGEFYIQSVDHQGLSAALMRIGPSQVLVAEDIAEIFGNEITTIISLSPERVSRVKNAEQHGQLDWFDRLDEPLRDNFEIVWHESAAAQQLFNYIDGHILKVQVKAMHPERQMSQQIMEIDRASIKGLELLETARLSAAKGSLVNTIKRTVTQGGTRLLQHRVKYPSVDPVVIEDRLNLLQNFLEEESLRFNIVVRLKRLNDMHRITQKISLGKGDAQDLLAIASTVNKIEEIAELLKSASTADLCSSNATSSILSRLQMEELMKVSSELESSLDVDGLNAWLTPTGDDAEVEETDDAGLAGPDAASQITGTPMQHGDPWVMQRTASQRLNHLHQHFDQLLEQKDDMELKMRAQFSLPRLSLRYDKKLGHICHTPRVKSSDDEALRAAGAVDMGRQKTVRAYSLPVWTRLGKELDAVEHEIRLEENKVFGKLSELVITNITLLRQSAAVMDELDVATAFASLAETEGWTRPIINTSREHKINGGWHPTVNKGLKEKGQSFTKNSLYLDNTKSTWLITGPNMAGKSTFLRQNALITILAQIGCYVPAVRAEIGIVDKLFSRIGAADDLYRNESTFMVEMLETAAILRGATDRSFVIMDEVGRGTAPDDGAAVAYAALHHLYNTNKCRTLFATHFHNLADKTKAWSKLAQYCTDIEIGESGEWRFQHTLRQGVNRNSHAFRIAALAGLPDTAIKVAEEALAKVPS